MMNDKFSYDTYLSVFTWRYGSPEMRKIFSEKEKRLMWRKIWVSLAEIQSKYDLISAKELADIKLNQNKIDINSALEIEKETKHDIMAEIQTFAKQAKIGGGKLHLGATSMDIEDNADMLRMKKGIELILTRLVNCLSTISQLVKKYKNTPCLAWTHLQPAEMTTVGYRFANYAQDLVLDIELIEILLSKFVKGKGVKGAVGTSASYHKLLSKKVSLDQFEKQIMDKLGLEAFPISTQTYPRKLDYIIFSVLGSIAQSVYKFGFDVRILQSPQFGEMSEPIGGRQIGSSAMPFKKNPITSERMCSLSRYVGTLPLTAFNNSTNMILERTLDDSANRRIIIPEGFLAIEESLNLYFKIISGLKIYPKMIEKNIKKYGVFSGTEALLMKLVENGKDRQKMHELIRQHSFKAWDNVMNGKGNNLEQLLKNDKEIKIISTNELTKLLNPNTHIGEVPDQCTKYINEIINPIISKYKTRLGKMTEVKF